MILLQRKQRLFLKEKADLSVEESQERTQIGARLPALEQAWQVTAGLRDWDATASKKQAAEQVESWRALVKASTCDPLNKASSILRRWREELLAFCAYRISHGFVQEKNTRTKMMRRRSYSCKNRQQLRLPILAGNLRCITFSPARIESLSVRMVSPLHSV